MTPPITFGYGLVTVERHPGRDAGWLELYREALDGSTWSPATARRGRRARTSAT